MFYELSIIWMTRMGVLSFELLFVILHMRSQLCIQSSSLSMDLSVIV